MKDRSRTTEGSENGGRRGIDVQIGGIREEVREKASEMSKVIQMTVQ